VTEGANMSIRAFTVFQKTNMSIVDEISETNEQAKPQKKLKQRALL